MICRGMLYLYSLNHEIMVSGYYESKLERIFLMNRWEERFMPMCYYFIIVPVIKEDVVKKKQSERIVPVNRMKHIPVLIDDENKVPIIRPKAEYGNSKSPYGLADDLHDKSPSLTQPWRKKPMIRARRNKKQTQ